MLNKTVYTVVRECNINIIRRETYEGGVLIGKDVTFLSIVNTGVLVETYFYESEKTARRREAWYPVNDSGVLQPLVDAIDEQNLVDICSWFFAHSNVGVVRYDDVNIEAGAITEL